MIISRDQIVELARGWLGTPYHHRASLKGVGCDCIGLVRGLWRELYGTEPETVGHYTGEWSEATGNEALLGAAGRHLQPVAPPAAKPGDVLVFRLRQTTVAKHAAILVSHERMIHAQEGAPVCEVAVSSWWRRRIAGAFVLPNVAG